MSRPLLGTADGEGPDRTRLLLIGGGVAVVILLVGVVSLVALLGGSSPAERAVQAFHASAKAGDCDEMMQLIQLPPADELPRPKAKLAELMCENRERIVDQIPDSIDTRVVEEAENSATVQAFGSVEDREWSETYELSRTDSEWRIRWGSEDS